MKPHTVLLRAPRELHRGPAVAHGTSGAPAILQRDDNDFIEGTLEDLRTAPSRTALRNDLASASAGGVLKLFQPVQRRFHLAVLEAFCDVPGEPRIDPQRIESAGMVLRRIGDDGRREGWMRAGARLKGWVPLAGADTDARHDPAVARRLAAKAVGPRSLARELVDHAAKQHRALLEEHVIPLFVAPPDVCEAASRTLYYGVVPTASSDRAEVPAEGPRDFGPESRAFRDHLVGTLNGEALKFDRAGETVSPAMRTIADVERGAAGHVASLTLLVRMLQQLAIEFDAFGSSSASAALFAELETIALPLVVRPNEAPRAPVAAGQFLKRCVPVLLERETVESAPEMPDSWPARDTAATARLGQLLSNALAERFRAVQSNAGRFDRGGARYQLRAFVRIKPECGCPARTEWSAYTPPFTIAPWYETAGAPAVQVPLPDPSDRALLKSLKPGVAFVVPAALNNLFSQDAKKLAAGEGEPPSGTPSLQWICSFSIPIITICAFIVLMIFLTLLDIIFRWMLFIRICIPFPKIGGGDSP